MAGRTHVPASKCPRLTLRIKDHGDASPTLCKRCKSDPFPIVFRLNLDLLLIGSHQEAVTHFENYFVKAQLAVRFLMCFDISLFHVFHYYFVFPTRIFCRHYLTTQSDGSLTAMVRVWNSFGEGS